MNRQEMAEKLAEREHLTESRAREIINTIFDGDTGIIARELARKNGSLDLVGFGRLHTRVLGARQHRNPGTGELLDKPAKRVVRWATGKNLKSKVAAKTPTDV